MIIFRGKRLSSAGKSKDQYSSNQRAGSQMSKPAVIQAGYPTQRKPRTETGERIQTGEQTQAGERTQTGERTWTRQSTQRKPRTETGEENPLSQYTRIQKHQALILCIIGMISNQPQQFRFSRLV
jgi:hypothetical protein